MPPGWCGTILEPVVCAVAGHPGAAMCIKRTRAFRNKTKKKERTFKRKSQSRLVANSIVLQIGDRQSAVPGGLFCWLLVSVGQWAAMRCRQTGGAYWCFCVRFFPC